MPDDTDKKPSDFLPTDPDRFYADYLETCRRSGVEPVSSDPAPVSRTSECW